MGRRLVENLQTHTHCLILAGTGRSKHLAKLVPCEGDGGTRSHSFFFFSLDVPACRILVPQPGIEPKLTALEEWSLNHWTTKEVPRE